MATQSLYRRYRPRRFGELKGQEHVVRALRDAVRSGREGQAYLFSGPRGTGKTTSARILAKVLNCQAPVDGEPCCECDSCLAVERGTSYDVHELDAASNNGVDAIRDLVEKASLGTPGRHRVYILDEVHMLSKAAEAALLKTLEEPPPHVVFVLATTDPQKVTETIRSRTQHLHFHLLPADTLAEHVRWVAADAGLELDERALDRAVTQGGGSARDTLSALELLAATGGDTSEALDLDDLLQAMTDHDPGRALTIVAGAVAQGHEARTLTEAIVRHLRDGFLALMAPELVHLPAGRTDALADTARDLGAPALVRAIERLGTALVEMRHAPDPRVVLEVALVQLTRADTADDLGALLERLDRLERAVQAGAAAPSAPAPPPRDPATGRAVLGGRARRPGGDAADPPAASPDATTQDPPDAEVADEVADDVPDADSADDDASSDAAPGDDAGGRTTAEASPVGGPPVDVRAAWEERVRPSLKPLVRAIYSAGAFTRNDGDRWYFAVPTDPHRDKCNAHVAVVQEALTAACGRPVEIVVEVGGADAPTRPTNDGGTATPDRGTTAAPASRSDGERDESGRTGPAPSTADTAPTAASRGDSDVAGDGNDVDEADIDLDDLTDAPPEASLSPIDRLAQAFPGAELVDDDRGDP